MEGKMHGLFRVVYTLFHKAFTSVCVYRLISLFFLVCLSVPLSPCVCLSFKLINPRQILTLLFSFQSEASPSRISFLIFLIQFMNGNMNNS